MSTNCQLCCMVSLNDYHKIYAQQTRCVSHAVKPTEWIQIKFSILGLHGKFRLATGWTVRGSNPVWGGIFHIRPDRPWAPISLLLNGYWVIPRGKTAGAWCYAPTLSKTEIEERVLLYLYPLSDFMAGHRVKFTLLLYLYTESLRKC
jgi:hypothetical protein